MNVVIFNSDRSDCTTEVAFLQTGLTIYQNSFHLCYNTTSSWEGWYNSWFHAFYSQTITMNFVPKIILIIFSRIFFRLRAWVLLLPFWCLHWQLTMLALILGEETGTALVEGYKGEDVEVIGEGFPHKSASLSILPVLQMTLSAAVHAQWLNLVN